MADSPVQRRVLAGAGADLDKTAKFGLSATMLAVVTHHEAAALEPRDPAA